MTKIKIAVVIPYIHKIEGNKTALLLASQLMKEGNDVSLIIWKIKSSICDNLKGKYPDLKIKYHKRIKEGKFGFIFAIKYQLLKGVDRKLSNMILNGENSSKFDFVIVPSNEGNRSGSKP